MAFYILYLLVQVRIYSESTEIRTFATSRLIKAISYRYNRRHQDIKKTVIQRYCSSRFIKRRHNSNIMLASTFFLRQRFIADG